MATVLSGRFLAAASIGSQICRFWGFSRRLKKNNYLPYFCVFLKKSQLVNRRTQRPSDALSGHLYETIQVLVRWGETRGLLPDDRVVTNRQQTPLEVEERRKKTTANREKALKWQASSFAERVARGGRGQGRRSGRCLQSPMPPFALRVATGGLCGGCVNLNAASTARCASRQRTVAPITLRPPPASLRNLSQRDGFLFFYLFVCFVFKIRGLFCCPRRRCLGPRRRCSTRCPGANLEADRSTWVQSKVSGGGAWSARCERPVCFGAFLWKMIFRIEFMSSNSSFVSPRVARGTRGRRGYQIIFTLFYFTRKIIWRSHELVIFMYTPTFVPV